MAKVIIHSDFGVQESKICHCFYFFPFICHEVMDWMPWSFFVVVVVFLNAGFFLINLFILIRGLSFKPAWLLSCFPFIKRLFSSSSISANRVGSSAHLRLFIFLLEILILDYDSSNLAFHKIYSKFSKVTICSLDILLSQFTTSLFFHVSF